MNEKKRTKKALAMSVLSMVLCVAMLVGMTFAWFTDTASTGVNKIQAGNLDVALEMADGTNADGSIKWVSAEGKTLNFVKATGHESETIFWEPGCTYELPKLRVVNKGKLALKYKVLITGIQGDTGLSKVIDWTINGVELAKEYNMVAGADEQEFTISGHMQESAGNDYQGLSIDGIAITVIATQLNSEFDSNGNDYDISAEYPVAAAGKVTVDTNNKVTKAVTIASADKVTGTTTPVAKVEVPENVIVKADTSGQLELVVNKSTKPANLAIAVTSDSQTLEVQMKGLDASNTTPIKVSLYVGKDLTNFVLYHHDVKMNSKNSADAVTGDQDYYYDTTTGIVTFMTSTFSPFTYVYDKKPWADNVAGSYATDVDNTNKVVTIATAEELALFAKQVNSGTSYEGYTVKLVKDINLDNAPWIPIGKSGKTFQGIFDGQEHTISNLFISSPNKSDVGLFGVTTNGEVKNFTLHNATVKGYLDVGAVAGTPYTSKYANINLTGDVKVDGYAYVGGMFGKNAYANLTDLTIDVKDGSYVNAKSENYRTYVGGLVGFMGEGNQVVKNVTSNIDVTGTTCDVGGITGIAHYGNTFINCHSSGDVNLTAAPDKGDELEIGGIAGVWLNEAGQTVTLTGCSYTGKLSSINVKTGAVTNFPYDGLVGYKYNRNSTDGTLTIN